MVSVKLENVTKFFGDVKAADNVTLDIEKGELFFLLGPSGCGKTTVLRVVAGFYRPDRGRLFFDGRNITHVPPHKRNTGMVFQNYALWPHMTVWKNVEYGLNMRHISTNDKRMRVERALEIVQMESYADRSPNQLSGGQQQRVALARALVIEPDVVLLDEPLSNLDAKLRIEMRQQIKRIHSEVGTTMIYVTHDQKEALSMADRIAVMNRGEIIQVGNPRSIYNRPGNKFVADFIGETNLIQGVATLIRGEIVVETPVGQLISTAAYDGVKVGDQVLCSVRPESIDVIERKAEERANLLSGRVESIMYLGEVEQYFLRLPDGTSIKAVEHNPGLQKAKIGGEASLAFDPEDVVILEGGK